MSTTHENETTIASVGDDPWEKVRENRDAYERLADSDLPIAPYCQNVLDYLDEQEESDA